ncbi:energy-coupling factor transport system permease protein [Mycoplasma testudineum]|uniref:Energy-coupling factor transport system permease protein n=1 Tax=Mycoplasma testudineum TaxID=244584 RepID=A0A4V3C2V7_9MOLU|nr:energy-coupling factor transporter transmembrane component T [Mycoplasma testudineum]OYD26623.1 hypothetical protein CG473_03245 [Mycoplasma testudineum]TDO19459.1 energy-coupling factor transport system permease protein [Mycoplasma testudineum]
MHSTHGKYLSTNNWAVKLDPRLKLIAIILSIVSVFLASGLYALIGMLILFFIIMILSKIPWKIYLTIIKFAIFFFIFLTLINGFIYLPNLTVGNSVNNESLGSFIYSGGGSYGGVTWYSFNTKVVTRATFITLRIVVILTMMLWLTTTTQALKLTLAFQGILSPLKFIKFPVEKISLILSLAIQSIPLLANEFHQVIKAQSARGIDVESKNIFRKAKAHISVVIPMFVNALKRAENLSQALEAKGYDSTSPRSHYPRQKNNYYQWLGLGLYIALLVFAILAYWNLQFVRPIPAQANYLFIIENNEFFNTIWKWDVLFTT